MMIACPLQQFAQRFPESTLFSDSATRISYRAADKLVSSVADELNKAGLKRGERIAVLAKNSINLCVLFLACLRKGICFVPLNLLLSRSEIEAQTKICNVSAVICDESVEQPLQQLKRPTILLTDLLRRAEEKNSTQTSQSFWDDSIAGCIIFTSGSRGQQKGVVLGVKALHASALASNHHTGLTVGDVWLVSLPLYHVSGLGILIRSIFAGAAISIPEDFSRLHILQLIKTQQISHLSLVPNMLEELLDVNLDQNFSPALKLILLGGAAAPSKLIRRAKALKIPLMYSYGLTETFGHICLTGKNTAIDELAGSGRALPHVQIEIINELGEQLANGQSGRIKLRSKALFSGYLFEQGYQPREGDEFVTQDLGMLDEQGRLRVLGRADDIINSGGEKFSAAEIELVARTFPQVSLAGVVAAPDQVWGQRPVLFVQVDEREKFSCAKLDQHLQQALPKLKWPSKIVVMDQLPVTSLGKINYAALLTAI